MFTRLLCKKASLFFFKPWQPLSLVHYVVKTVSDRNVGARSPLSPQESCVSLFTSTLVDRLPLSCLHPMGRKSGSSIYGYILLRECLVFRHALCSAQTVCALSKTGRFFRFALFNHTKTATQSNSGPVGFI